MKRCQRSQYNVKQTSYCRNVPEKGLQSMLCVCAAVELSCIIIVAEGSICKPLVPVPAVSTVPFLNFDKPLPKIQLSDDLWRESEDKDDEGPSGDS